MKVEIKEKQEFPLLSRTRIIAEIEFEHSTPPALQLKTEIAKRIDSKPNLVVVRKIKQKYGSTRAEVVVHVYKDEKIMKRLEESHILNKNLPKQDKEEVKNKEENKESQQKPKEE